MVLNARLSPLLRSYAAIFWSLGLAFVAFDRIFLFHAENENVKIAYLFFGFAGMACAWAEKREFGTRVALYRLHDIAVSSPWNYLLLYFLWVNLFAPFTEHPLRSVIYACGGWFSLVVVAYSAQLIFCDRNVRGIALIPSRLRIAFFTYNGALIALAYSYILSRLFPSSGIIPLFADPIDVAIYFASGVPFLIWDYANPKRQLLPRPFVAFAVMGVTVALFLMHAWIFLAAVAAAPIGLLAMGIYKKIRLQRSLAYLAALCLFAINGVFIYTQLPTTSMAREMIDPELAEKKVVVEEKLRRKLPEVESAFHILRETNYLGGGIGSSDIRRGVWLKIIAEVGVVGLLLYAAFFASLLERLLNVRHSQQIVVSNVALVSAVIFIAFLSHFPRNPYGTGIWVWYALWGALGSTRTKRDVKIISLKDWKRERPA